MPEFVINNIPVHFPFEPYDVQKEYMSKVIDCLQNGKHGMLESPTGTGKTLSLLCSSLAWLTMKKAQMQAMSHGVYAREDGDFVHGLQNGLNSVAGAAPEGGNWGFRPPQIIYSSRTHSQLTQAMSELGRTQYAHMKTAVLGSRDQLCIHPDVSKETNSSTKISMCRTLGKSRGCTYLNNVERKKDDQTFHEHILDIEDLVKAGQKLNTCPYYMSRELKNMADVVFMPYQYLLDVRTRKRQDIMLQNCVIILDEGHNVEKICEDSASFELTSTDIATCIAEVTEVMKAFATMDEYGSTELPTDFTTNDLMYLKKVLLALEKAVDDITLHNDCAKFNGSYVFQLLGQADINHGNHGILIELLSKMTEWLSTTSTSPFQRTGSGLDKLQNFLKVVFFMDKCTFDQHAKNVAECYKVYVTLEKQQQQKKVDSWLSKSDTHGNSDGKIINFWCFNPGFGMRGLVNEGVHSVIVTSGTLAPLSPLISELGIPIDVTLENGHVITKEQVYVGVLQIGPDGVALNSSFKNRSDSAYMLSLGRTIRNVAKVIPNGLLVFFPSYFQMEQCKQLWMQDGVWDEINRTKEVCVEPRSKNQLKEVMDRYYNKIAEPGSKGACFLAVCRGKVSEGLDFVDHNGRGVIITGLPYPPFMDPQVVMKREYLDHNKKRVTGHQWYQLEATRAVNQAIGRVIRHRHDYGVILFCDNRFSENYIQKDLSCWIRNQINIHPNFGSLARNLAGFFRNARETLPQPDIKPMSSGWTGSSSEVSSSSTIQPSFDLTSRFISKNETKSETMQRQSNFSWSNKKWGEESTPASTKKSFSETRTSSSFVKTYRGGSTKSSEKKQPVSIFTCLEETKEPEEVIDFNNKAPCLPPSNLSTEPASEAIAPSNSTIEPSPKRRKIKMACISIAYEKEAPHQTSSESQSTSREQMIQYLQEIKKVLTKPKMKRFNQGVSDYSKTHHFDNLVSVLESVFDEPQHSSYIIGFKPYIKGRLHAERFTRYCTEKFGEH